MSLLAREVLVINFLLLWIFNTLQERGAQPAFCGHLNHDFLWLFWLVIALFSALLLEFVGLKFRLGNFMMVEWQELPVIVIYDRSCQVFIVQFELDI